MLKAMQLASKLLRINALEACLQGTSGRVLVSIKTIRSSTTLITPVKIVTTSGARMKATAAVRIAAAMDSARPVVKIVGAITAMRMAGGKASSAAFSRPFTTTPRMR